MRIMRHLLIPLALASILAIPLSGSSLAHAQTPRENAAVHRFAKANAAIIGGALAQPGMFASVAEILDMHGNMVGQCTGTVVAPNLVLTAGHCAENVKTGIANGSTGYRILTGGVQESSERQISTVSGVLPYEGYARKVDDDDAALLVLATATTAPPIRLATGPHRAKLHAGSRVTIVGWGETHYGQSGPTRVLHWTDSVAQSNRWCKRNAPPFYARGEICAIDPPTYATGACSGDSGGPLLAHDASGEAVEVGIVVHGYTQCSTRLPTVFTRVAPLAAWVQTWINAYEVPPATPPA
jgi:secreted trypsin-like serine protease